MDKEIYGSDKLPLLDLLSKEHTNLHNELKEWEELNLYGGDFKSDQSHKEGEGNGGIGDGSTYCTNDQIHQLEL